VVFAFGVARRPLRRHHEGGLETVHQRRHLPQRRGPVLGNADHRNAPALGNGHRTLDVEGFVAGAHANGFDARHELFIGENDRAHADAHFERAREARDADRAVLFAAPICGGQEPRGQYGGVELPGLQRLQNGLGRRKAERTAHEFARGLVEAEMLAARLNIDRHETIDEFAECTQPCRG